MTMWLVFSPAFLPAEEWCSLHPAIIPHSQIPALRIGDMFIRHDVIVNNDGRRLFLLIGAVANLLPPGEPAAILSASSGCVALKKRR